MSKYKTDFELREHPTVASAQVGTIEIQSLKSYKCVKVSTISGRSYYMNTKDLERFAVNILRALKSKHLNP